MYLSWQGVCFLFTNAGFHPQNYLTETKTKTGDCGAPGMRQQQEEQSLKMHNEVEASLGFMGLCLKKKAALAQLVLFYVFFSTVCQFLEGSYLVEILPAIIRKLELLVSFSSSLSSFLPHFVLLPVLQLNAPRHSFTYLHLYFLITLYFSHLLPFLSASAFLFLPKVSLCGIAWSGTHRDPPASSPQCLDCRCELPQQVVW